MIEATSEHLISAEMAIYAAYQQQDISAIDRFLAEDFCEIDDGGRFLSRDQVLDAMRNVRDIEYRFESFKVLGVNQNCAIVAYIVSIRRTVGGQELLNRAFRTSTWRKGNDSWKVVFHQVTPLLT